MSTAPRLTALDALHRSLGATMTDFAGWDMPLRYGSERDEHVAVRTRAGLFDLSHMGEITVTGPQAVDLLDHALVGNISTVGNGRARYTMICQEDGGILDDLIVYRLGEDRVHGRRQRLQRADRARRPRGPLCGSWGFRRRGPRRP
jgi:aminomethyltransferase